MSKLRLIAIAGFSAFVLSGPAQHLGWIPQTTAGTMSLKAIKTVRDAVFPRAFASCGTGWNPGYGAGGGNNYVDPPGKGNGKGLGQGKGNGNGKGAGHGKGGGHSKGGNGKGGPGKGGGSVAQGDGGGPPFGPLTGMTFLGAAGFVPFWNPAGFGGGSGDGQLAELDTPECSPEQGPCEETPAQ